MLGLLQVTVFFKNILGLEILLTLKTVRTTTIRCPDYEVYGVPLWQDKLRILEDKDRPGDWDKLRLFLDSG